MRLDMIQTKVYKQALFPYQSMALVFFAMLLGILPIGYYLILPSLLYFYLREDHTKYLVILGYLMGGLYYGIVYVIQMLLLILVWNAFVQIANLTRYHWLELSSLLGVLLVTGYGFVQSMPIASHLIFLVAQAIFQSVVLRDFYQDKQVMLRMGIAVVVLTIVFVCQANLTEVMAVLVIHGILLFAIHSLSIQEGLFLILLSHVFFYQTLEPSYPLLALLLVCCIEDQARWKKILVYCVVACLPMIPFDMNPIALLTASAPALALLLIKKREPVFMRDTSRTIRHSIHNENKQAMQTGDEFVSKDNAFMDHQIHPIDNQANRQSASLLHQFSSIFHDLSMQHKELAMLATVADVFQNCGEELYTTYFREQDIQRQVEQVLASYQYQTSKIWVETRDAVTITLHIHKMHHSEIDTMIVPLLSKAIEIPLHVIDYQKTGFFDSYHTLVLSSERGLSILYDSVQQAIDNDCGDAIKTLSHHEHMLFMMSDGMGSGTSARQRSTFALSMVEKLILANVPLKATIKLVNQLALLQEEERFATLDLLSVDRFKKIATLYKSGSVQTYLIRKGIAYSFQSDTLPLGIIERINPEYYSIRLLEGDQMLLLSDGADHEQMKQWLLSCQDSNCSRMLRRLFQIRLQERMDDDVSMTLVCFGGGELT